MIPPELMSSVFLFALSGIVLVIAGNWVIDASKKIAIYFRIGGFTVGFVLLAVATSLPELAVSLSAGLQGHSELIISNLIGSNIADILLVLGASAVITTLWARKKQIHEFAQVLFLVSIIPLILLARSSIGFFGGIILIGIFVLYIYYLSRRKAKVEMGDRVRIYERLLAFGIFAVSIALLLFSANLFVSSGVEIANFLDFPKVFLGLFILALGTSLPELVLNVGAMFKKQYDLAIGNILGSCVFNLTLILGIGALVTDIPVDYAVMGSATIFLVIVNLLLWYLISTYKRIDRRIGIGFLVLYALFILAQLGVIPFLF
jgi:cation:H+ antiporter